MKKILTLLIVCLFLLLSQDTSFAKETTYIDNNYNFSTVKTIFIWPRLGVSKGTADPYAYQKSSKIIKNEFFPALNVRWVTLGDIRNAMVEEQGINLNEEFKKDRKKATEIFYENLPKYADLTIYLEVLQFGHVEKYVPPRTFSSTRPDFVTVHGQGWDGTAIVERESTYTIGGYSYENPTAALTVTLYDNKTEQVVWGYSHVSAGRGGLFQKSKTPEIHLEWLCREAIKQIPLPKKPELKK
jgi:hypothetical protein